MIKLKDINVRGVSHANVFSYDNKKGGRALEGMDIIIYKLDKNAPYFSEGMNCLFLLYIFCNFLGII